MKLTRRQALASGAAALLLPHDGEAGTHGRLSSISVTWDRVVVNGGGFMSGLSYAQDGTLAVRGDQCGSYIWNGTTWSYVSTQIQLPYPQFGGYLGMQGLPDMQLAPSNSNVLYQMIIDYWYNNSRKSCYIYKSTNKGVTSVPTNYPQNTLFSTADNQLMLFGSTQASKRQDKKIAVDPANPNVVYACNPGGYPLRTFDGGSTWSNVPSLPTGQANSTLCSLSTSAGLSSVQNGGTGGTPGTQTATVVGGTFTTAATLSVTVSAGGAITSINSVSNAGSYTEIPRGDPAISLTGTGIPPNATANLCFLGTSIGAVCWTFDPTSGTTTVNGQTVTNTIYVAIEGNGLWRSTNGGQSWTQLSSDVGFASPHYCGVSSDGTFYLTDTDPNTWDVATKANPATWSAGTTYAINRVVAGSNSHIYRSITAGNVGNNPVTDGGVNWTDTGNTSSGCPLVRINRYKSGVLSIPFSFVDVNTQMPGSRFSLAVHPTDAGTVYGMRASNASPHLYCSNDYGTTWTTRNWAAGAGNETYASTEASPAPWLVNQNTNKMLSNGPALFNPANPNVLIQSLGQGIYTTTLTGSPPNLPATVAWSTQIGGVEEALCDDILHETGTNLFTAYQDIQGFVYSTNALSTSPSLPLFGAPIVIGGSWGMAIDPTNFNYVAVVGNNFLTGFKFCGYSANGTTSATFTPFGSFPAGLLPSSVIAGDVSVNNGVILYCPYSNIGYYWSSDNGTTWTPIGLPGGIAQSGATSGWGNVYSSIPGHVSCADRIDPNTFYIYNTQFGNSPVTKGIWISTDGGRNFTWQGATSDPYRGGVSIRTLKAVPDVAVDGHSILFAATGWNAGTAHPVSNNPFSKSIDQGVSWTAIPNMLEVNAFAFGKAGSSGIPTLFVCGFYKNQYGVYMSQDLGVTWLQLISTAYGIWPIKNDTAVQCMEGDKNVFGRCYVGFRGGGAVYSTLA